jgi:cobalt/nickel transport system permease protein
MKARAFRPAFSLHTYRSYANLVGMLLVRSVDRAERVHAAMLCRGYTGRFWFHDHFRFTRLDLAGAALAALLAAGVLALNVI